MNVFFFGDSICFGQFVSPHKTWVSKISRIIDELGYNEDIKVINASISGNTTRMALERMPFDVQSYEIDVILIQFGINDCNFWATDRGLPRISKLSFEANLNEIIDRSFTFGAKKIFINTNHQTKKHIFFNNFDRQHQEENEIYNDIIRKVAKDRKVVLIDIEKEFNKNIKKGRKLENFLLNDGIHINIEGHNLYFSIVCDKIIHAIKELLIN